MNVLERILSYGNTSLLNSLLSDPEARESTLTARILRCIAKEPLSEYLFHLQARKSPLEQLPSNVLLQIFQYLSKQDACALSLTSRRFACLSREHDVLGAALEGACIARTPLFLSLPIPFQRDITLPRGSHVNGNTTRALLRRGRVLEKLTLSKARITKPKHLKTLAKITTLRSLHLDGCHLTWHHLEALKECQGLRELTLSNNSLTHASLVRIVKHFPHLERLDISSNRLTQKSGKALALLKNLEVLDVSGNRLSSRGIDQLRSLPKLKELRAIDCVDSISFLFRFIFSDWARAQRITLIQ